MKTGRSALAKWFAGALIAIIGLAPLASAAAAATVIAIDQGSNWTSAAQLDFYSHDQGSRLMPYRWILALKQANGEPFMAASLSRYGYLPNDASVPAGLPVGFVVAKGPDGQNIGLTCAACHTRQIEVSGSAYRIDGGPAIVDLQSFLADLDVAVGTVVDDPQAFADFAGAVLGPRHSANDEAQLQDEVNAWYLPYHTLMQAALPAEPWGPSRLDALSMIFNRIAGLDLGPPPTYLIPENIAPADAPARYPFLWNSQHQTKTQWPGISPNGNDVFAMSRNLGEVYGVFAIFHPKADASQPGGIDYLADNSAAFRGMEELENLVRKLGPPKWPWAIDTTLATQGEAIFERPTQNGGCVNCHGITAGHTPAFDTETWNTPILDVGTDSREYNILSRTVDTGVLGGASAAAISSPAAASTDSVVSLLGSVVAGTLVQRYVLSFKTPEQQAAAPSQSAITAKFNALKAAFGAPTPSAARSSYTYESRVLQGIWAAAPYLHNGSVPTLSELLKPAAARVSAFKVGPAYDPVNVGLAVDQTRFNYTLTTTDCSDRNSGNSRCGHEYGTALSADEKKALLEYLKTL